MNTQNERVLGRVLARELTQDEIMQVSGAEEDGAGTGAGTCVACTCAAGGGNDYCRD